MGCDVSSVLLEEVICYDLLVLGKFINIFLDYRVNVNFFKGRKSFLDVVIELDKIDVVSILIDRNVMFGGSVKISEFFKVKELFSQWYIEGLELNMWL